MSETTDAMLTEEFIDSIGRDNIAGQPGWVRDAILAAARRGIAAREAISKALPLLRGMRHHDNARGYAILQDWIERGESPIRQDAGVNEPTRGGLSTPSMGDAADKSMPLDARPSEEIIREDRDQWEARLTPSVPVSVGRDSEFFGSAPTTIPTPTQPENLDGLKERLGGHSLSEIKELLDMLAVSADRYENSYSETATIARKAIAVIERLEAENIEPIT